VGDFYAEESRDVLFKVKLAHPRGMALEAIPHVEINLGFTDTIGRRLVQTTKSIGSIARPPGYELSEANTHVEAQWLRVYAVQQMGEAERWRSLGNSSAAMASLQAATLPFRSAPPSVQSSPFVKNLQNDLGAMLESSESATFDATLSSNLRSHQNQRSNAGSMKAGGVYSNSKKKALGWMFMKK